MAEQNRTIVGIFVALVVIVAAAFGWWYFSRDRAEQPVETSSLATPTALPEPTPTLEERLSDRLSGTTLATSDAVVRELTTQLSSHPKLAAWLVNEDLIRRLVASVDNIASGVSPREHLDFMRPKGGFEVDEKPNGVLVIDPDSYRRYDVVAEVFDALDTEGAVVLYHELEPLIDDAYAEISPPNADFDRRLARAIDHLLAAPVLRGTEQVEQLVVTYAWADDELEALSSAQRQLLRMGPENVRSIQGKLRELKSALEETEAE